MSSNVKYQREIPINGNCQRCRRPEKELLTLYLALAQEPHQDHLIPLTSLTISGGTLEICPECHREWLAAIKTWFENPTTLREVPRSTKRGGEQSCGAVKEQI